MNKISIKNFSEVEIEILNKLNKNGKGYIVGGAIRDILLGLKPKDVDFTIKAMAYNETEGIVDLYNGQKDIENKVINFVGNAEERIIEDPLRVLRAFRFMSRLDFSLSENTIEAIKKQKDLLKNIPEERITMEFSKLLLGKNIKNTLTLMKDTGVLELIIPEFKATYDFDQCNPHHNLDLFNHIISVVSKVPADLELKYSALLHDIAKPIVQIFD